MFVFFFQKLNKAERHAVIVLLRGDTGANTFDQIVQHLDM